MIPRCTLGVIGGGQLGRMLALTARRMNIPTIVWTGGHEAPAAEVADESIDLPFDHPLAMRRFCATATVATVEFENIPASVLEAVAANLPLHPSPKAVATCQNRQREKEFLHSHAIPCAEFAVVTNARELAAAIDRLGPGVLKTADFGYDGNGQIRVRGNDSAGNVWQSFNSSRGIYEEWVDYKMELSVVVARGVDGHCVCYDPVENHHRNHILDLSIAPARISSQTAQDAMNLACQIAHVLDYRGLMCVELFLKPDGSLLVNEIAPRPHNSGHHTLDACATSQFEQQLRAVTGQPLGSPRLLTPVAMLNLLGELWASPSQPPNWQPLFDDGETTLHLYGKKHASPRRKMGHANLLAATPEHAHQRACQLKAKLLSLKSAPSPPP